MDRKSNGKLNGEGRALFDARPYLTPGLARRYNPDMKRGGASKKSTDRRKRPRSRKAVTGATQKASPAASASLTTKKKAAIPPAEPARKPAPAPGHPAKDIELEQCHHCGIELKQSDRALFVEEEVGRVFCSEECIAAYFGPEIERLEKEYSRHLVPGDLTGAEREEFAHLRWITLQEPDETWREKTLSGDYRYTLISEFDPGPKKIWSICICLFLRGEPSFLYLAFVTRNAAMVDQYRRGEQIEWQSQKEQQATHGSEEGDAEPSDEAAGGSGQMSDRLADPWTEEETHRARLLNERREDDIPAEEFHLYQGCVEETLEEPDEVWSIGGAPEPEAELMAGALEPVEPVEPGESGEPGESSSEPGEGKVYHFIRHYPEEAPGFWYVIVAREIEDAEQIELLEAFPTRDPDLVERCRRGNREVGSGVQNKSATRVVH